MSLNPGWKKHIACIDSYSKYTRMVRHPVTRSPASDYRSSAHQEQVVTASLMSSKYS